MKSVGARGGMGGRKRECSVGEAANQRLICADRRRRGGGLCFRPRAQQESRRPERLPRLLAPPPPASRLSRGCIRTVRGARRAELAVEASGQSKPRSVTGIFDHVIAYLARRGLLWASTSSISLPPPPSSLVLLMPYRSSKLRKSILLTSDRSGVAPPACDVGAGSGEVV